MEQPAGADGSQATLRACDQCRARKIRCDKGKPCVSCLAAGVACVTGAKSKVNRQRVLISSQYEQKIDNIGTRLGNIEMILKRLPSSSPSQNYEQSQPTQTFSTTKPTLASHSVNLPSVTIPYSEGSSSLHAYATLISNHLRTHLSNSGLINQAPDLKRALTSLHRVVSTQRSCNEFPEFSADRIRINPNQKHWMPPVDIVLQALNDVKLVYDSVLGVIYPIPPYDTILSLCKDMYFQSEDISLEMLVIVYETPNIIFRCYSLTFSADDLRRDEFEQYCETCAHNMVHLSYQLRLFMPHGEESLRALLLAAFYTIQSDNSSLCSVLVPKAASMCLAMGYHHAESMDNDSLEVRQRKTSMFWFVYILDRGLCLRHGRPPLIQDRDITVRLPASDSTDKNHTAICMIQFWINLSKVQGRIHRQFYSSETLTEEFHTRKANCEALVADIRHLWATHDQCGFIEHAPVDIMELFWLAGKVALNTTLTLVLRTLPPPENEPLSCHSACVDAARQALEFHEQCTLRYKNITAENIVVQYLHCTLLAIPFAPFLVIFCQTIKTRSLADLDVLKRFVETLQPVCGLSTSIERFFMMCTVFHQFAKLYIEANLRIGSHSVLMVPDALEPPEKVTGQHAAKFTDSSRLVGHGVGNQCVGHSIDESANTMCSNQPCNPPSTSINVEGWPWEDQLMSRFLETDLEFAT